MFRIGGNIPGWLRGSISDSPRQRSVRLELLSSRVVGRIAPPPLDPMLPLPPTPPFPTLLPHSV